MYGYSLSSFTSTPYVEFDNFVENDETGYGSDGYTLEENSGYSVPDLNYDDSESESISYGNGYGMSESFSEVLRSSSNSIEKPLSSLEWNEEFQRALEQPSKTPEEHVERIQNVNNIMNQFVDFVTPLAKQIITEENQIDQKIKPYDDAGGIAGGEKYIHQGVFFKFARDKFGLFKGNDEIAIKVAGLDLAALRHLIACNIPNLHFPMTVLVNYLGRRIIASSILPITRNTIIYGSADAGKTIYNSSKEFSLLMEKLAIKLNIKGHLVGKDNEQHFIHGPFDMEGHAGMDGRYYLLDFSRLFPCQVPTKQIPMGHLYRLFRGEFVKKSPVPLSSDAYCNLSKNLIDAKEIKNANALLNNVVPVFSNHIHELISIPQLESNPSLLCEVLHREGINLRFLGIVYQHISSGFKFLQYYVAAEILSRSLKKLINKKIREIPIYLMDDIFTTILKIYTLFFSSYGERLSHYIEADMSDYITSFHASSIDFTEISDKIPRKWLFDRLSGMLGIIWYNSNESTLEIFISENNDKITPSLIKNVESQAKYVLASIDNSMNPEKLQTLYRNQITIRESNLGSMHPFLADSLENLAGSLSSSSQFKEAESCLLRAINIRENYIHLLTVQTGLQMIYFLHCVPNCGDIVASYINLCHSYINLALLYRETARYNQAIEYVNKSLDKYQTVLPSNHYYIAESCYWAGWILKDLGIYDDASNHMIRAMKILSDESELDNPLTSLKNDTRSKLLLGSVYVELGRIQLHLCDYTDALENQLTALKISEAVIGREHSRIAVICNNLSISYCIRKEFATAASYANRALSIRKSTLGPKHSYVAHSICAIVQILLLENYNDNYLLDENMFIHQIEEAENIYRNTSKRNLSTIQTIKGKFYHASKKWTEAMCEYGSAYNILQKSYGNEHMIMASASTNLAALYYDMAITTDDKEKLELALKYAQEAHNIRKLHLNIGHPELLFSDKLVALVSHSTPASNINLSSSGKIIHLPGFHLVQSINISMLVAYLDCQNSIL